MRRDISKIDRLWNDASVMHKSCLFIHDYFLVISDAKLSDKFSHKEKIYNMLERLLETIESSIEASFFIGIVNSLPASFPKH